MAQAQLLYVGTRQGVAILSNPGRTDRWLTVGIELPEEAIAAVACVADQPMQAEAWSADGHFSTADGGQQWTREPAQAPSGEPLAAATASRMPSGRLEAGFSFAGLPPAALRLSGDGLGIERSADEGATWEAVALDATGAPTAIAPPAYHQDTAYLGTASGEVWLSTDRGRSWTRIKRDLPPVTALAIGRVIS